MKTRFCKTFKASRECLSSGQFFIRRTMDGYCDACEWLTDCPGRYILYVLENKNLAFIILALLLYLLFCLLKMSGYENLRRFYLTLLKSITGTIFFFFFVLIDMLKVFKIIAIWIIVFYDHCWVTYIDHHINYEEAERG